MWPAILLLVFLLALSGSTLQGDGWFWAVGNGLGFLSFGFLLILATNGRAKLGRSERHRWLGLVVAITVLAHCLWFLMGDPITLEYLKWGAPHYMVAGLFSTGLLILLTISSLISYRNRSYANYSAFRLWHKWLSVAVILTALVHIGLSGLYFTYLWQWALLLCLSLVVYFTPKFLTIHYSFQRRFLALGAAVALLLFVLLRLNGLDGISGPV